MTESTIIPTQAHSTPHARLAALGVKLGPLDLTGLRVEWLAEQVSVWVADPRARGWEVVVLLSALAHTVLVWAREWLREAGAAVQGYGLKRLVREVWGITGRVEWDGQRRLVRVILNQADRLARRLRPALATLVAREHLIIIVRCWEGQNPRL